MARGLCSALGQEKSHPEDGFFASDMLTKASDISAQLC